MEAIWNWQVGASLLSNDFETVMFEGSNPLRYAFLHDGRCCETGAKDARRAYGAFDARRIAGRCADAD